MKLVIVGATGTIGGTVIKAPAARNHEIIRASRNGEIKFKLEHAASIRAMFEKVSRIDAGLSCDGNAAFKPFADLTDADYELGLRSKLGPMLPLAYPTEQSPLSTEI